METYCPALVARVLKPAVVHDAGIARYFDENVFKTQFEAERPISFVFPGNDRARRVNIVQAVRLRDRGIAPESDQNP